MPEHSYDDSLLRLILHKGKATMETQLGMTDDGADIHEDLVAYDGAQYVCMDTDKCRVAYFQQAVNAASNAATADSTPTPTRRERRVGVKGKNFVSPSKMARIREEEKESRSMIWLEIGPGATGVLTRMILEASDDNSVVAIEAVARSVKKVSSLLQSYGERFRVVEGLAGSVSLPHDGPYDAIIAEILGHFGSSEGYVSILHQCARAYPHLPTTLKIAIPMYFGTAMVPVDLTRARDLRIAAVQRNVSFFVKFPFAETQLSEDHGTMEMYNAFEELREEEKKGDNIRSFQCEWTMTATRPCHGFAFYVKFADSAEGPWTSSNFSSSRYCNSWCNIFLPVNQGRLVCQEGDRMSCEVNCHVGQVQPWYDYYVKVVRGEEGMVVHEEDLHVAYSDLVCRFDSIRGWRQFCD